MGWFAGDRPRHEAVPMHHALLAGGIAGTVQWLPPFYCIDVLKVRLTAFHYPGNLVN